jgi:two-component system, response regulator
VNEGEILLVEDNPDDVDLTLRAFRRNSLKNRIVVARDGAEAQAMLFGEGERLAPALVLLDLKLPKVSGLELLSEIRADERTVLLPVIILTSSVEEEDLVAAYRSGVNSYIRKPVDFTSFLEVVRELGLYWLDLNEPAPGA